MKSCLANFGAVIRLDSLCRPSSPKVVETAITAAPAILKKPIKKDAKSDSSRKQSVKPKVTFAEPAPVMTQVSTEETTKQKKRPLKAAAPGLKMSGPKRQRVSGLADGIL